MPRIDDRLTPRGSATLSAGSSLSSPPVLPPTSHQESMNAHSTAQNCVLPTHASREHSTAAPASIGDAIAYNG